MNMWNRAIGSPSKTAEAVGAANAETWQQRMEAIMAVGPSQQCMSFVDGYPFGGRCRVPCAANVPHEHRTVAFGDARVTAPWGRGRGNPWEEADRSRVDGEWFQQAADAANGATGSTVTIACGVSGDEPLF
jgi:hypothetical protein